MKMKKTLPILLVLIFVLMPMTEVMASESYPILKFCSKGNQVYKLQRELQNKGYYTIAIDGIFGLTTEKAVIDFQKDNGLRIDGFAGPETQKALYRKANTNLGQANSNKNYDNDEVFWLSRIIQAEAGGESYTGKVAVGNVILNRVKSKDFPNTIYGVIFDYHEHIPQFSPVAEGTIYNTPSKESIKAAKDALNGARPVGNSTYFFNQSKAKGAWIVNNKTFLIKIGGHSFYI